MLPGTLYYGAASTDRPALRADPRRSCRAFFDLRQFMLETCQFSPRRPSILPLCRPPAETGKPGRRSNAAESVPRESRRPTPGSSEFPSPEDWAWQRHPVSVEVDFARLLDDFVSVSVIHGDPEPRRGCHSIGGRAEDGRRFRQRKEELRAGRKHPDLLVEGRRLSQVLFRIPEPEEASRDRQPQVFCGHAAVVGDPKVEEWKLLHANGDGDARSPVLFERVPDVRQGPPCVLRDSETETGEDRGQRDSETDHDFRSQNSPS